LISKKQFLCNKKPYCTLVPRTFIPNLINMRFYGAEYNNIELGSASPRSSAVIVYYYIRLYFTVFLLARSNTRDIPFSNILISKMQFLCNKKSYCTLVQNQWMKVRGTRVQYGFLLHRNWLCSIKPHIDQVRV
jgi:hypothetical protein